MVKSWFVLSLMIKNTFYLIAKGKRSRWSDKVEDITFRMTKQRPALSNDEIAVLVKVNIPEEYFERIQPAINIELPKDATVGMTVEAAIEITGIEVAEKLKLEAQEVIDGLTEIYKKKLNSEKENEQSE